MLIMINNVLRLLLFSIIAFIIFGCANEKRCTDKYKELWINELVTDTIYFTDSVFIEPITLTDTINIYQLINDTTYLYRPVYIRDSTNKVALSFWRDGYKRLLISCTSKGDTVFIKGRNIYTQLPCVEKTALLSDKWLFIIGLSLTLLILLVARTIVRTVL